MKLNDIECHLEGGEGEIRGKGGRRGRRGRRKRRKRSSTRCPEKGQKAQRGNLPQEGASQQQKRRAKKGH